MTQAVDAPIFAQPARVPLSLRTRRWLRTARKQPLGVIGGLIIAGFVVVALLSPVLAPHDPRAFVGPSLQSPSRTYPLGTNNLGQDVYSRTVYGTQVSLAVGVASVLLGTSVGTFLALISGYFGRWIDMVVQRGMEIVAAFPGLLLILVVVAALGRPHLSLNPSIFQLMWDLRVIVFAIGVGFIFGVTRVVRSAVISQRGMTYVEAAQACGAGTARILLRHILPNVMAYVIVGVSVLLGVAILAEAALSFLGYGVPPGTPSWGADLAGRNRQYYLQAPWLVLAPGLAISLTLLGFNLLGDALRDVLDPRLRGST
jgi:ABC-type dipeptide/oligopeptide/nickel transport system permease subunit